MSSKADATALNEQFLLACENANIPMARALVKQGANPEATNSAGETALHLGVKSGNTWVVNYLVEELLLPVDARDSFGRTALHWAAQMGNAFMVESLIMAGADLDAEDEKGIRVTTYAEREGHIDIVRLIILVANSRV